jgi:hypothetical protein
MQTRHAIFQAVKPEMAQPQACSIKIPATAEIIGLKFCFLVLRAEASQETGDVSP